MVAFIIEITLRVSSGSPRVEDGRCASFKVIGENSC